MKTIRLLTVLFVGLIALSCAEEPIFKNGGSGEDDDDPIVTPPPTPSEDPQTVPLDSLG